jgi:hypothetical protein
MNEDLYNYLFHFNYHTGLWNAIPREKVSDYFNGKYKEKQGLLTSGNQFEILTLVKDREKKQITN